MCKKRILFFIVVSSLSTIFLEARKSVESRGDTHEPSHKKRPKKVTTTIYSYDSDDDYCVDNYTYNNDYVVYERSSSSPGIMTSFLKGAACAAGCIFGIGIATSVVTCCVR